MKWKGCTWLWGNVNQYKENAGRVKHSKAKKSKVKWRKLM